LAIALQVFAQR